MKLEWNERDSGRTELAIRPSREHERVSFPRELIVDTRLDVRLQDRMWVAAALSFGDRIAGPWDGGFEVSEDCAVALQHYLGRHGEFFPRVSTRPAPTYLGGGTLHIVAGTGGQLSQGTPEIGQNEMVLDVRPLGDWVGHVQRATVRSSLECFCLRGAGS